MTERPHRDADQKGGLLIMLKTSAFIVSLLALMLVGPAALVSDEVALSVPAAAQTSTVSCGYVEGVSTPFPASPHISLLSAAGERIGQAPAGPQPWPARGSYVCVTFIPGSPGTFLSYVTPSMPGYLPATSTAADPDSVRPIALLALLPAAVLWIFVVAKKRRLT
jgi:hypothetical protein